MTRLQKIQRLCRLGKALGTVVFWCSVAGGIGCIAGMISLAIFPGGGALFRVGSVTVYGLLGPDVLPAGKSYAALVCGLIMCAAEAVLARMAARYFADELEAGTPFTEEGARSLMRLGIWTVALPLIVSTLIGIVATIAGGGFSAATEALHDDFTQIGLGVAFMLASLLCGYGAEKEKAA